MRKNLIGRNLRASRREVANSDIGYGFGDACGKLKSHLQYMHFKGLFKPKFFITLLTLRDPICS